MVVLVRVVVERGGVRKKKELRDGVRCGRVTAAMKGVAGVGDVRVVRRALRPLRFRFDRSPRCVLGARERC